MMQSFFEKSLNIKSRIKIILLVVVFIAPALTICILVFHKVGQLPKDFPPDPMHHSHPGKERMLAILQTENLDQSIGMLIDDSDQYFFPYVPPVNWDSQNDLEQMLATRRALKVLQEIKSLSKSQGRAKCEFLFSKAFQLHTNACLTVIKYSTDPTAPTNSQSMLTTRMALSAAMFIAAETARLDVLKDQFAQLDQWRAVIEPLAKLQNRFFLPNYGPALNDINITPDFRLQVNVLRLAALRSGNTEMLKKVDEACLNVNMQTNTIPIVAWNADTTAFELLPDSPLDTRKGVTTYTFYDWGDKMQLNRMTTFGAFKSNAPSTNALSPADEYKIFVRKLESIVFQENTTH